MTEKKTWLVVTFYTTSAAMAMEKLCREQGIAGKLIPVPRQLSADCGMAWRGEVIQRERLQALAEGIETEGWYEIEG